MGSGSGGVWEFVDCPTCPAKTGQKCRTLTTGRVTDTHQLRFDRYHEWRRRELERLFDDHRNPSVTDN